MGLNDVISRREFIGNSVKGLFSLEVVRRIPSFMDSLFESKYFPYYELTQKQIDFIKENNINIYLRKYSDLFFKNAEDIRKGKVAGSPLEDMLKIMDEEKIFPDTWDMVQLTKKYRGEEKEIRRIFALYGLQIIDGIPRYIPTRKELKALEETGLRDRIDMYWDRFFSNEIKEKLRIKRQSGKFHYGEIDGPLLFLLIDAEYNKALGKYLFKHKEVENTFEAISELVVAYTDTKLFEEIPQKYKLIKYPKYLELKLEPKEKTKNINSFILPQ